MDKKFKILIENLHSKFEELINMKPVKIDSIPQNTPIGGIYLFSENGTHLYAGRTKREIKQRLKDHVSNAPDCPFAWHLAREKTGYKATYKKSGSRTQLLKNGRFKKEYDSAKERIREMEIRYVGEPDSLRQALLEIYVALATNAKFNDFDTH